MLHIMLPFVQCHGILPGRSARIDTMFAAAGSSPECTPCEGKFTMCSKTRDLAKAAVHSVSVNSVSLLFVHGYAQSHTYTHICCNVHICTCTKATTGDSMPGDYTRAALGPIPLHVLRLEGACRGRIRAQNGAGHWSKVGSER